MCGFHRVLLPSSVQNKSINAVFTVQFEDCLRKNNNYPPNPQRQLYSAISRKKCLLLPASEFLSISGLKMNLGANNSHSLSAIPQEAVSCSTAPS